MYWKPDPNLYPPYLASRIRRGRGVGQGKQYVPWLKVRDVPSRGTSSIPAGITINRSHHLLSELEAIYFYLTERKATTVDIREQWPILHIDRTIELSLQFGVRHRYKGPCPDPYTIDFLVTECIAGELRYRAASVKTPQDAKDPEIRLRLAIEHAWCSEQGIPWTLVDTTTFSKTMLATLRFMRGWFQDRFEPKADSVNRFAEQFQAIYRPNVLLSELLHTVAKRLRLNEQIAQSTFQYCAWTNSLEVSLQHPLLLNKPLVLLPQK